MKLFSDARQVLKSAKHKKPTLIYCPKCASPELKLSNGFGGMNMWLTPMKYFCEKCGYVGPIYMEMEKEEEKERV